METDATMLLALLALRLRGSRTGKDSDTFLKPFANQLKKAIEQGLARETEEVPQPKSPTKKPPKTPPKPAKPVKVLNLTELGDQYLLKAADPATLAVTLEADRQQLRAEFQAAIQAKVNTAGDGKAAKSLDDLSKKVSKLTDELQKLAGDLAKHLEKISPTPSAGGDPDILKRVDQAFATLLARLEHTTKATGSGPQPVPIPSLRDALHAAYTQLCLFLEFKDGIVELPRLYHETHKALPHLTVKEFKDELMSLWQRRELDLYFTREELAHLQRFGS